METVIETPKRRRLRDRHLTEAERAWIERAIERDRPAFSSSI